MNQRNTMEDLGVALRTLRENRKLRQQDVAKRAGITRPMLSGYERGRIQPTMSTLERILTAMDAHIGTLAEYMAYARGFHPAAPEGAPPRKMSRQQLVRSFNLWLKSVEEFHGASPDDAPPEPEGEED
jgi:transcriptional regulator with XRE-family HTH domain